MVAAVAMRVPTNEDIKSLRHDLTDAIYATDNQQLLYSCLIFLNNQNLQVSDIKAKNLARLTYLARLADSWDGEGSLAINQTPLDISRKAVLNVSSELLENWVLFPDARGYGYTFLMSKDILELDEEFPNRDVNLLPKPSKRLPFHAGIFLALDGKLQTANEIYLQRLIISKKSWPCFVMEYIIFNM